MKLPNLISKVLAKAAPMSASEKEEIDHKMNLWFEEKQAEAKKKQGESPETLSITDKALLFLDEWYLRALFAMAYIWLVRVVQDWMNPADNDEPFEEEVR